MDATKLVRPNFHRLKISALQMPHAICLSVLVQFSPSFVNRDIDPVPLCRRLKEHENGFTC